MRKKRTGVWNQNLVADGSDGDPDVVAQRIGAMNVR
jgi:hypothetical protein